MKKLAEVMRNAGKYVLTDHAKDRIRQRAGIFAEDAAVAWVAEQVKAATSTKRDGNKTHYITGTFEIVLDGVTVITVKPCDSANEYLTKFNEVVAKETSKLLSQYTRALRKAEIAVAEAQLNFLKAKNPKTRELISEKMTEAIDRKCGIEDEIKKIEIAAKRYGVSV